MNPDRSEAFADFRDLYDPTSTVHGSCVTGLSRPNSDVDVITAVELYRLYCKVQLHASTPTGKISVVMYITRTRMPRLVLKHVNGVELDIVQRLRAAKCEEKDDLVIAFFGQQPLLKEFVLRVLDWGRRNRAQMPTKKGYPNSWTLTLISIFFLQNRPKGRLLPSFTMPMAPVCADVDHCEGYTDALYVEFLMFLMDYKTQVRVDIRVPSTWEGLEPRHGRYGVSWYVVDPITLERLADFKLEQAVTIHNLVVPELNEELIG
jgi:DNA polymerase sigma